MATVNPQAYLKAVAAGGTAFAGAYGIALADGVVSQGELIVTVVTVAAAVAAVYIVPNQNEDGSWGSGGINGALEQVTALASKVSAIVTGLAAAGVLRPSDPVVASTPELAAEVVVAAPSVPVVVPDAPADEATAPEPIVEVAEPEAPRDPDAPIAIPMPAGPTPVDDRPTRFDEPIGITIFDDVKEPTT